MAVTGCCLLVVGLLAFLALSWKSLLNLYDSHQFRKLRAEAADEPFNGTEEHLRGLLMRGAIEKDMTYEQVISVLGAPDSKRFSFEENRVDKSSGERRCLWLVRDLGGAFERYVITFGPNGRADFVPYVVSRKRDEATGTTYARMVKTPEEARGK